MDPLDQNFGCTQFRPISVFGHQLEPNRQRDGLDSGGHNEEKGYEELRGDKFFLIGLRGMVEVNINAGGFCRGAWDLSVVKSHDDCITADQLKTKWYPLFENIAAAERAIFNRFVVAGPLISEIDSKERICNVPRRSDKGTNDEFKKCGTKFRGEKREAAY